MLYKEEGRALIIINKDHPENRQRFTSAHELGHFVLKHKGRFFVDKGTVIYRDNQSSTGEIEEERDANKFAAELLMPEKFIRRDVKKPINVGDVRDIDKLAKKYKVSVQAMTYRLTNLQLIR
jgi:Zn-dependent peptidase ImmA (M78 family)